MPGSRVARQRRDCEALAASPGWTVVDVYADNDILRLPASHHRAGPGSLPRPGEHHLPAALCDITTELTQQPSPAPADSDPVAARSRFEKIQRENTDRAAPGANSPSASNWPSRSSDARSTTTTYASISTPRPGSPT